MSNHGTKNDTGKLPLDLIPPECELSEAAVWAHGALNHGAHNFRKGILVSRILAAIKRHTNAIAMGQDIDQDINCNGCRQRLEGTGTCAAHSGQPHTAHLRCSAAMLEIILATKPEFDDRINKKVEEKELVERASIWYEK